MNATRFWLPIGLGLAAAMGNWLVLRQATATHELLALRADLRPGQIITDDVLRRVPVRGENSLWQGTVPAEQLPAILGKPVKRYVKAGELVFLADLESSGSLLTSLIPEGHQSLTLAAKKSSLASGPVPRDLVTITLRSESSEGGVRRFGPFLFLGWQADPARPGMAESDLPVRFMIAMPTESSVEDRPLRELPALPRPERVVSVEVMRPVVR